MTHPAVATIFLNMAERDLSSAYVARRAGVQRSTLMRWRLGRTSPKLDDLVAVLDVLGIDLCPLPKPVHAARA